MKRLEVIKAQKAKTLAKQGCPEEPNKEKSTPGRKILTPKSDTCTESSWTVAS